MYVRAVTVECRLIDTYPPVGSPEPATGEGTTVSCSEKSSRENRAQLTIRSYSSLSALLTMGIRLFVVATRKFGPKSHSRDYKRKDQEKQERTIKACKPLGPEIPVKNLVYLAFVSPEADDGH